MPFDVFAAIGAMVRAEATRTTEPAPFTPSAPSTPSDPEAIAHPAETRTAPHPLQEPVAGPAPQPGPLLPGLSA
ncbi:hypothetical protein ACFZCK_01065 [Kitasatospora purpeofusca]|uniref:hypothetical protein n=1 Tax=Kitasatospora purpeofusca TaxID=67352 RepID=UPI0036E68258